MTPTSIETLLEVWESLGPMERLVLNTYAWRLRAGQRKYGMLHEAKKEWTWEAAEECLDSSVYLSAALVAFTEESKRKYFAELDGIHPSVIQVQKEREEREKLSALEGTGS